MLHHAQAIARRKLNKADDWEIYRWEKCGPDACLVRGGVPTVVTRGKTKGQRRWDNKQGESCVVTDAEIASQKLRFQQETGKCAECVGKGEVFASWHHIDGTKYRPCTKCNGTGLVPST